MPVGLQAAFMLFRTMTGEGWQDILRDTANSDIGGGWWAYPYWISFTLIVTFVMLKLFVLVIVDESLRQDKQRRSHVDQHLSMFQVCLYSSMDVSTLLHKCRSIPIALSFRQRFCFRNIPTLYTTRHAVGVGDL
jgi:hypothetical protein